MRLIPHDQLDISPDRIRRTFDSEKLQALASSIQTKGLLHPIVVRYNKDAQAFQLVAGERRVRAMTLLHQESREFECNGEVVDPGHFPAIYIGRLSDVDLLEAEVEENTRRVDLSWQEQAEATAALHRLRQIQNPEQTATATASELPPGTRGAPRNATFVTDSVALVAALEDPEIADAPTRHEALQRMKRKAIDELSVILAGRQNTSRHTIIHGPYTEHFEGFGKVGVIVTDPPYGISADKFGDQTAASTSHGYEDSPGDWLENTKIFLKYAARATAAQAHLYMLMPIGQWYALTTALELDSSSNIWRVWPRPLIWWKGNMGLLPQPNFGPRYVYDAVLYLNKGQRPVTKVAQDVIYNAPQEARLLRGASKPVSLYRDLLTRSANPGEIVWDPFGGTGPILRAAEALGLTAFMHDIDKAACDLAAALLADPAYQPEEQEDGPVGAENPDRFASSEGESLGGGA